MDNRGVYGLWLYLPQTRTIAIGRLGTFSFEPGVYVYLGSAQRGLEQRVARHSRLEKKLHWHIDYFRAESEFLGAVLFRNQGKPGECQFAQQLLGIPGTKVPVPGFGSSDCDCATHFFSIPQSVQAARLIFLRNPIHNVDLRAAESFTFFNAGD